MKKLILFLSLATLLICFFAFSVSAEEKAIEASTLAEIKAAISESSVGDTITVNLTEDIIIPKTSEAIVLDKDITVIINFHGHIIVYNGNGGSAGGAYGMALRSKGARLVLNGSTEVDYKNYDEPTDQQITVSNGKIVNPNEEGTVYPDYTGNGPCVVVFSGTIELNNMYVRNHNLGEWTIFFYPNIGNNVELANNIKAKNSIVRAPESRYAALGTRNGGGNLIESLVEIEDCVIYGTSQDEWLSMSANSYIRNTRIALNSFKIDSYMKGGQARDGEEAILQNVIFEHKKLSSCTGAIYVKMIDCQFPNGEMELYVTGDSQGKTRFTIIETANCEKAGRQAYIECWKGGGKTLKSFEDFPNIDTAYTEQNPAFGHNIQSLAIYENGYLSKGYKRIGCTRCDDCITGELNPIFTALGYAVKENGGDGMLINYAVNNAAISEYEEITGKELTFGFFAVLESKLGENKKIYENGSFANGVCNVDYSNKAFDIIEFKITGFKTEEQKSSKIAMGVYVFIEGEDASYLQGNQNIKDNAYNFVTYKSLVHGN